MKKFTAAERKTDLSYVNKNLATAKSHIKNVESMVGTAYSRNNFVRHLGEILTRNNYFNELDSPTFPTKVDNKSSVSTVSLILLKNERF